MLPLAFTLLAAQADPVYVKTIESFTPAQLDERHNKLHKESAGAWTGLTALKLSYISPRSPGKTRRLSGALFLPRDVKARGLVIYYHGTVATRGYVPSRSADYAINAAVTLVGQGFAVAMPDYVGLGDSGDVHPYPFGRLNAWSGIDMIQPSIKAAKDRGYTWGDKLFISGYSEGGAIAMWATKLLQEQSQHGHKVTASAPIAGPYDLTGATAQSIISTQSNPKWRLGRSYLSGYLAYSAARWVPGVKIEELFVPSMASYIPFVFEKAKSDKEVMEKLAAKALQLKPMALSIRPIIQPQFADALESKDLNHPLIKALHDDNSHDWAPTTRMKLIALENDFIVTSENSRSAIAAMRARGVPESLVDLHLIQEGTDHIKAETPSVLIAAKFFSELAAN